ncbi:MAG: hypothetical protein A7316_10055 [Candidatus Altiarchaeales archaeon WOR_SM1_86-2]|nr:MAG: hypothetical protein A7316_10055 [Candidatus Altiarchaeales archaeon WOR_SM1_86-2]ODS38714.1 MAG: hypothetical protein A7315_11935 [Candidatus Altiarchaeales archaeon WOR_SM1_79]
MFDLLILALIGILIGIVTGLTPGLHVNTIAVIGLSLFPALNLSPIHFGVVMVSMAVTHTFLDFIPSIFLGAPEESTALSILPTHRLLLQGNAFEAVKLTAFGSLFGLIFALILLIPAVMFVPVIYHGLHGIIAYIILLFVIVLFLLERKTEKILWAVLVFFISGYFGILIFDLKIISPAQVLFPVFAGLFGLSNILWAIISTKQRSAQRAMKVPQNRFIKIKFDKKFASAGFLGAIGGAVVGIMPAMSPSQIGILMYSVFGADIRNFIVSISAINTSDAIYSLAAVYTIGNPRSGVAVMISEVIEIDFNTLLLFVGVIAFTAIFATLLHIKIGKLMLKFYDKIDYVTLCAASFTLIIILIFIFTGIFGVMIGLLALLIGMLPILSGISRTHVVGVLIFPTVLYFMGVV